MGWSLEYVQESDLEDFEHKKAVLMEKGYKPSGPRKRIVSSQSGWLVYKQSFEKVWSQF